MEDLKLGSTGPEVELLQSTLKDLGFYNGEIDGIFGPQTQAAVKDFQKAFGITADGIVGPNTFDKLFPYINGYTLYKIKPNDTFYSIANFFGTSVEFLLAANPKVNPYNLQVNQVIVVPTGDTVPTNVSYTYKLMEANVIALNIKYPFLQSGQIGQSVLGNSIPYVRIGNGPNEVFYNASIHANEWITSVLLMKFIENFCKAYVMNDAIYGQNARTIFDNSSIYIVPMINPDGVDLVTGVFPPTNEIYKAAKVAADRYPNIPFPSGWKANIKGESLINFHHFIFKK